MDEIAEELGIEVKPSTNPRKKYDIYKNGEFECSIGAINFLDYRQLVEKHGIEIANKKRELYLKRHKNNCTKEMDFTIKLLWFSESSGSLSKQKRETVLSFN